MTFTWALTLSMECKLLNMEFNIVPKFEINSH